MFMFKWFGLTESLPKRWKYAWSVAEDQISDYVYIKINSEKTQWKNIASKEIYRMLMSRTEADIVTM